MLTLALLCSFAVSSAPDVSDVAAVLERNARPERAQGLLVTELAALGPARIPDLFAVLAFGSGLERPLLSSEEDALAGALASFGAPPLRSLLKRRLSGDAPLEERLAALRVLARVGTSQDIAFVRQAVPSASPGLARMLQETCTAVLRRDARALEALRRWMLEAPLEIGAALAGSVGKSDCPRALEALASTLGFRTDLDAELLAEIANLVGRAPRPLDEELLRPIEDALEEDDVRVLRAAALALGHAEHTGVLPTLIQLLEHENRGVSTAAEWALEAITGLRFHADAQRWRAWVRSEQAWLEREGPRLRRELRAPSPAVAIRALGELGSHRWRRHELALEALQGLEHESPLVRRLACTVVARLGSSAAEPGLVRALEDEDESVARAARQALDLLGLSTAGGGKEAASLDEPSSKPPLRSRNRSQHA
jgi:HEAT repeat protein